MPLAPGTRLGVYEVVGPLGSGGMGDVYRARDTRLQREVALKVLPERLATDAEHLARLEREARLLAALSHPNIATIHGLDESDGVRALVLELVEGPTLAERLRNGPLGLDETLRIARQLVDALEAAHAIGIVHRDLKPSNIKLRPDGAVKVLDFGLAKALESARPATDDAQSPTITGIAATRQGTILGTAAYMSPEQARGHDVGRRADIWAFGCVVYEMLTGTRAFAGKDVSETLAFVIMKEPDWTTLPADAPPAIRRLLRRALEKDQRRRLADVSDARLELEDAGHKQADARVEGAAAPAQSRERLAWLLAVSALALVAIAAGVSALRPDPQPAEMRVDIATPSANDPTGFAISPDGQKIVFVAATDGASQLWLRYLNAESAQPLPGTEDARLPFWSPDSRSIGFGSDAQLKRIDLDGGSVRGLASAPVFLGGTWNQAGEILFVPNANVEVFRVSASGGEVVAATRIAIGQSNHSPSFLPDGRHFLYYVTGDAASRGVHVAELGKDGTRRLLEADTGGVSGPSDVILFTRRNTAFAQRVERSRMELVGEATPIAENVAVNQFANSLHAGLSASASGPVVYRAGQAAPRQPIQFGWFDRSGKKILDVGDPLPMVLNAALAPDEQRITAFIAGDIWILDTRRARAFSRFTFDRTVEFTSIWSPDATRLAISSNRAGQYDLYEKSASGAGTDRELLVTKQHKDGTDWSPDGAFLLYRSFDPRRAYDILALRLEDRKSFPLVQTDADERNAQFSPDGKWIAYQSNESGRFEIWVQPFSPGNERRGKWQISTRGGGQVRWNRNGRELFYISPDGRLMAAPMRFTPDGNAIEPSTPQPLFRWVGIDLGRQGTALAPYAVSKDGQRFLFATTSVQSNTFPLTMILNWRRP